MEQLCNSLPEQTRLWLLDRHDAEKVRMAVELVEEHCSCHKLENEGPIHRRSNKENAAKAKERQHGKEKGTRRDDY